MDSAELHLFAKRNGVSVESAEWDEQTRTGIFGILSENLAEKVEKGKVSHRKLGNLVNKAEEFFKGSFSYVVFPAVPDESLANLAKTAVETAYPNVVIDNISGWYTGVLTIGISVRSHSITRKEMNEIQSFSSLLLRRKTEVVNSAITGEIFPSAILKVIKKASPVNIDDLLHLLQKEFITELNQDWLGNELDKLRKDGAVVRLGNGEYVLTLKTLKSKVLGPAHLRADIERVLHLARKKW